MTTRPADPSPAPRDDAPAVVWVIVDRESRTLSEVHTVRSDAAGRCLPHRDEHVVAYQRVPDAATLDARLAAVDLFARAVMLLRTLVSPTTSVREAVQAGNDAEALTAELADSGALDQFTALASDLRAARDAAGRDAHG
jgi:hypothetical protein